MYIDNRNGNPRKGFRSYRLQVDMTPMVDLGFLLITFFVFTTSMTMPNAMKLVEPKGSVKPMAVKCSSSFTILIRSSGELLWYGCLQGNPAGIQKGHVESPGSLRAAIASKQNDLKASTGRLNDLMVLIKPFDGADFKSVVDILDEMTINGVSRYAIAEPDASDLKLLQDKREKP